MRLEIYDDKKEKNQSWEARIRDDDAIYLCDGYGIDAKEALEELDSNLDKRIRELNDFKKLVQEKINE